MFFYSEQSQQSQSVSLQLVLDTSSFSFNNTFVGENSNSSFSVTSTGNTVETVTLSDNSDQYTFSPSTFQLTGGVTAQTVTVTFSPTSFGTKTGTLTLSSSGGDIETVNLSALCVANPLIITSSVESVSFASGYVNETSSVQFTVSAGGTVQDIVLITDNTEQFDFSPTSFSMTGANQTQTITVYFTPTSSGAKTGLLTLSASGGDVATVSLNGTAVYRPLVLTSSVNSLSFNTFNNTSTSSIIQVWAGSTAAGNSETVTVSENSQYYSVSPSAITVVGNGGTTKQNVTVTFAPTVTGTLTGTLTLSASGGSIKNITMSGTSTNLAFTQVQRLASPQAANEYDNYGSAVAMNGAGNTIVVCGFRDEIISSGQTDNGFATVYISGASGWTANHYLTGSLATQTSDGFGYSVAIDDAGDTIVIGATGDESPGNQVNTGLAYVFKKISVNTWRQVAILSASLGSQTDALFGRSVDINDSGNRIIVGAPYVNSNSPSRTDSGEAYIFVSGSNGWTQQAILKPPSPYNNEYSYFGQSVSINNSGDRIAINAVHAGSPYNNGAAIIFVSSSSGWIQQAVLATQQQDGVSHKCNVVEFNGAGDRLIAGGEVGQSTVFISGTSGWTKSTNISNTLGDRFAMNNAGDRLFSSDFSGNIVRLLVSGSSGWVLQQEITGTEPGGIVSRFGRSITTNNAGNRLLVGAPWSNWAGGGIDMGLAFVFSSNG